MHRSWIVGAALVLGGCPQEYQIADYGKVAGANNPPLLETPTKTDTIVQVTTPEVDVLWVIDNSCSMLEEQEQLSSNFASFIGFFLDSGLDWHVGVVSTDTSGGGGGHLEQVNGVRYLDSDTQNPIDIFGQMAVLGTMGDANERGRRAAQLALTDPVKSAQNLGFYRENASLNVIVISDENDYSGNNPTRNEFVDFLLSLKGDPETVTFSSIVGPVQNCWNAIETGADYIYVTNQVGGIHESICTSDWAQLLEELGLQAAGLKREYFLSEVPVSDTIEVWVDDDGMRFGGLWQADIDAGTEPECEYDGCFGIEYDQYRNSILMRNFIPSPLASINVHYELLSGYSPVAGDADGDTGAP
jgi:hypothetical protein